MSNDKIEWIVNDIAELGVMVNGKCYFLYKGESIIYKNEDKKMQIRTVGKREFGECCHPINDQNPNMIGTVSLDDCDRWVDMPVSESKEAV